MDAHTQPVTVYEHDVKIGGGDALFRHQDRDIGFGEDYLIGICLLEKSYTKGGQVRLYHVDENTGNPIEHKYVDIDLELGEMFIFNNKRWFHEVRPMEAPVSHQCLKTQRALNSMKPEYINSAQMNLGDNPQEVERVAQEMVKQKQRLQELNKELQEASGEPNIRILRRMALTFRSTGRQQQEAA